MLNHPNPERALLVRERIGRAMSVLSGSDRALVSMLVRGMTDTDMATELGIAPEAVRKRIERMRAKARASEQQP
jgi:DNA-directed RNA polymerase specialized sigma24 family protein